MNYGSIILKELIQEVKSMSAEDYNALYEEASRNEEVRIVLPGFNTYIHMESYLVNETFDYRVIDYSEVKPVCSGSNDIYYAIDSLLHTAA